MNPTNEAWFSMQINQVQKGKLQQSVVQRRKRRKPLAPPPGQKSDQELIAAFIAERGITNCPPGYAMGALKSSALGLDT